MLPPRDDHHNEAERHENLARDLQERAEKRADKRLMRYAAWHEAAAALHAFHARAKPAKSHKEPTDEK